MIWGLFPIVVCLHIGLCRRWFIKADNLSLVLSASGAIFLFGLSTLSTILCFLNLLSPLIAIVSFLLYLGGIVYLGRHHYQSPSLDFSPLLALFSLPYFLLSAVPIWYRDSLSYHVALPKLYAQMGGFAESDHVIFSYFPQSWHSILSYILVVFPDISPRMLAPWISLLCGLSVLGISRHYGATKGMALLASTLFLLIPTQVEFGSALYVQGILTLFTTFAIFFSTQNSKHGAVFSGVAAGFCASLKLSGIYIILILGAWRLLKQKNGWFFWGSAVLVASPFYLRNIGLTGNPVYPLLWPLFGGSGWDEWRSMAYAITLDNYGQGRSLLDYILLPVRLFFTRDLVGHFQGSIGPIIGFLLILGAWQKRKNYFWGYLLVAWFGIWAINVQQIRFFMPLIPIMLALSMTAPLLTKRLGIALILAMMGWSFGPNKSIWSRQSTTNVLVGQISPSEFLTQKLPENYPIYQWLNAQEYQKVWLVWMRGYHYYLNKTPRIDNVFGAWRFETLLDKQIASQAARAQLQKDNIDAVVINHRFFLQGNAELEDGRTLRLQNRFQTLLKDGVLVPEFQHGPVTVYALLDSESSESSME